MAVPLRVDREQVLAFRLARHNLARRLPGGSLLEAAACGIQNTPPGSAALALQARVHGLTPAEIDRALETDRSILQCRCMRTAPYLFPARDLWVFTAGLLPEDEESLRFYLGGAGPALDRVGLGATEVLDLVGAELMDALDGRVLTFRELSSELTERVSRRLSPEQSRSWRLPSWYATDQSLGAAIVHFALYGVALRGLFCFAPRRGNEASLVRTDQWLGMPLAEARPEDARAELVRRYLRRYGPSMAAHFGEWAGISPAAAARSWALVEPDLVEVLWGRGRCWLLERDAADFGSPPAAAGVRLLPPHDPYLLQRDRETLLPDRALRARVWKTVGSPGVVLVEERVAGVWRPRKSGRRLAMTVEPFEAMPAHIRSAVAGEASLVAPFRGCTIAEVAFAA